MTSLIEGIGDEVVYSLVILVLIAVITLAWMSTGVRPLWGAHSLWYVQLQMWPQRRLLQVLHMDEGQIDVSRGVIQVGGGSGENIINGENVEVIAATATGDGDDVQLISPVSNTSTNAATAGSGGDVVTVLSGSGGEDTQSSNSTATTGDDSSLSSSHYEDFGSGGGDGDRPHQSQIINLPSTTESTKPGDQASANSENSGNINTTNDSSAGNAGDDDQTASSASTIDQTLIKLKFLDETQRLVPTVLSKSVGEFKRAHFESEVSSGKVIRLIYQGQLLRDDNRTLESYGLQGDSIVHCHVSNTPITPSAASHQHRHSSSSTGGGGIGSNQAHQQQQNPQQQRGLVASIELGPYLYVIFAIKFIGFWAFYLNYPQYFDFASLFSLLLISLFFMAFLYSNWSSRRRHQQLQQEQQRQDRQNQQQQQQQNQQSSPSTPSS